MSTDTGGAKQSLYFGYGSNLWKDQMIKRCPTSSYCGIARLRGYRWIINKRGYANVVETFDTQKGYKNVVWGLVFALKDTDEAQLDLNEGVPEAYTKEYLTVDFWSINGTDKPNVEDRPQRVEMLVYIDRRRVEPSVPKKEYIYRMNMGIKDAVLEGMPKTYVDDVLRYFIPDVEDDSVSKFAQQQAIFFDETADHSRISP